MTYPIIGDTRARYRIPNRQTLGGLVAHCYPLGPVFVDTGDVDGKAVAAIPFQILVP